MARGTELPPTDRPLEIPRNVSQLEVYLPLGSAEGAYAVRVTAKQGQTISSGNGNAQVEQGATVLKVDLKPALSASGMYLLEIRRSQSEWGSFPMRVH